MHCPFSKMSSCDYCPKCIKNRLPSGAEIDAAIDVMAMAVISGMYGNGETRKELLYKDIQRRVNRILYS